MPIKEAERSGSTFLDLRDEAGETFADSGTLIIFRIVSWEDEDNPTAKGEYGWNMPFLYDALVIDQDEDGEVTGHRVYLRQSMLYGSNPAWVLRGHDRPDPKLRRSELPKPTNDVGDEIIGRVKRSRKGFVVLNAPTPAEKKLVLEERKRAGGDAWGEDGGDTVLDRSQKRQQAAKDEKPADDLEPPF